MVEIRVPATTANLGPGFDCLGMAVSLFARFLFKETEEGFKTIGFPPEFEEEDNLVYQAYLMALKAFGLKPGGLHITAQSQIPVGRGLGSSAACAVAGILAAAELRGVPLSREDLFNMASGMEGHPDNAAPAVYGGLRVSIMEKERALSLPCAVHRDIKLLALVPDFELPTKKARAALPSMVSMADAVYNVSRAAYLLKALEFGDSGAIRASCGDRLHQARRFKMIPGGRELSSQMLQLGADACFISGAGPTLMCLYRDPAFLEKAILALREGHSRFSALPLLVSPDGARAERIKPND